MHTYHAELKKRKLFCLNLLVIRNEVMKNLIIPAVLILFCMSCEKDDFNVDNPDIEHFVQHIKDGSYNKYELGVNGEKLWAIMPNFTKEHIHLLLKFADDTSLVCPCDHFPANPASSIPPYRMKDSEACIMVGEYLLWCVEGIIGGNTFASLTPILIIKESNIKEERLSGEEVLEVRKIYLEWWEEYEKSSIFERLPLEETIYGWR